MMLVLRVLAKVGSLRTLRGTVGGLIGGLSPHSGAGSREIHIHNASQHRPRRARIRQERCAAVEPQCQNGRVWASPQKTKTSSVVQCCRIWPFIGTTTTGSSLVHRELDCTAVCRTPVRGLALFVPMTRFCAKEHGARVDGRATARHLHGIIERAVRCYTVKVSAESAGAVASNV